MALIKHEVTIQPGHAVAVNGKVIEERPVYAGRKDEVHLVSSAPAFFKIAEDAASAEGVSVKVAATVVIALDTEKLAGALRDGGSGNWRHPVKVSAESVASQQKLVDSLAACCQTFARNQRLLILIGKPDDLLKPLNELIRPICARAKLSGEMITLHVTPSLPSAEHLAQLRARAEKEPALKEVVEYFMEARRQAGLLQAEVEMAKAEGERQTLEAQQKTLKARADFKIAEAEEESRKSKRQAELDASEAEWGEAAMQRNARIKGVGGRLEYEFKLKQAEQAMELARQDAALEKLKEEAEAAVRQAKRADLDELDLHRERELAGIRIEEETKRLESLNKLAALLKDMPSGFEGVQTVVQSGVGGQNPLSDLLNLVLTRCLNLPGVRGTEALASASQGSRS